MTSGTFELKPLEIGLAVMVFKALSITAIALEKPAALVINATFFPVPSGIFSQY